MMMWLAIDLLLSVLIAVAAGGLYLAWPRPTGPEDWVLERRRALVALRATPRTTVAARLLSGDGWWAARLRWTLGHARADLRLLAGPGRLAGAEERLVGSLLLSAVVGAGPGMGVGLAGWLLDDHAGVPVAAAALGLAGAALLPCLAWMRIRRRAARTRAVIMARLPRLLTGARMLLESGAATPQRALATVAGIHRDPAADILREVAIRQEVHQDELADALDQAGRDYGLEPLRRLADAYRVGTRQGTRMADLLLDFALDLQRAEHVAYRERMTRAPVLMTVPALVFFVLPLLALVLLLVFAPLGDALGHL